MKHTPKYVIKFATRHDIRPLYTSGQKRPAFQGNIGKRIRYSSLISDEDICRPYLIALSD